MVLQRSWNFNNVRVLTTLDLLSADDPTSDFGSALQAALEGLAISANLPSGGATGTILKKLSEADGDAGWATLTAADITDLADELAGKADVADVTALTAAIAALASQASVDALTASLAAKADQSAVDDLSATVATKADIDALDALAFTDLADVATTAPSDGDAWTYDGTTGQQAPTDLTTRFPSADPSTRQLLPQYAAPFTLFGFIVPEGSNPPAGLQPLIDLGLPIIGYETVGAPDPTPVLIDSDFAQTASSLPLALPGALAVGTKLGVAIGYSGEATVPDHFDITVSTGAVETTFTVKNAPNTTAAVVQAEVEVTTAIDPASTLTITARDAANALVNRVHLLGAVFEMPNSADDSLDVQKNSGSIASSSSMTAITAGPTDTDTAQADEVAIGVAMWSGGSAGVSRTLEGTNGWNELAELNSDNGTTQRNFWVGYLVLTATGKPQLTTLMTSSDGQTGQAAAQVAAFKGA